MRNRPRPATRPITRPITRRRAAVQSPLPHPSWSPSVEGQRVSAQEFWQRLGL